MEGLFRDGTCKGCRIGQREGLNFEAGPGHLTKSSGSGGVGGPSEMFPAEARSLDICTLGLNQHWRAGITQARQASQEGTQM